MTAPVTGRNVRLAIQGFKAFGPMDSATEAVRTLRGGALCDQEGPAVQGFPGFAKFAGAQGRVRTLAGGALWEPGGGDPCERLGVLQ